MTSLQRLPDARPHPFKRSAPPLAVKPAPGMCVRLLIARLRAEIAHEDVAHVMERDFPADDVVIRAASTPAQLAVANWAGVLGQVLVADLLESLVPFSASADLLKMCLTLQMDRAGEILVPHFVANDVTTAKFVGEGAPIPVYHAALVVPDAIIPHKIAGTFVITREMLESSNAERVIGEMMLRSMGETLDQYMFSANAADATRPAGLFYNSVATPPSSSTDWEHAVWSDVGALLDAVGNVAGNSPLLFVGKPGRAMRFVVHLYGVTWDGRLNVAASSTSFFTQTDNFAAIVAHGVAAALSPQPVIEIGQATSVVMDDAGVEMVTSGGVVGAPARSMWQTDSLALKIRWPISWTRRDPRAAAFVVPTGW